VGYAVIFSAQANRDLAAIVAFIAENNPAAAERLGNALVNRALMLGPLPHLGSPVRQRPGARRLAHKPWVVIYYEVDSVRGVVAISRFWDARQNPDAFRLP
jgi:plasmid stabilization system protein ParE